MKKLFALLILVIVFVNISKSQTYKPLIPTGSDTVLITYVDCNVFSYVTINIFINSDTTIDGNSSYRIVDEYEHAYGAFHPQYGLRRHYFIREDSLENKVYVRYLNHWNEELLYDFSLSIGDSINLSVCRDEMTNDWDTLKFFVTSVDSLKNSVNNEKNKAILLEYHSSNDSLSMLWIESIGSLNGFDYKHRYFEIAGDLLFEYLDTSLSYPKYNYFAHAKCKFVNEVTTFNTDSILLSERSFEACDYQQSISLAIKDEDATSFLKIFPNPASTYLNIEIGFSGTQYQIFDSYGRRLLNGKLEENRIDVSSLVPGLYFLRVESDGKAYSARFVKE